MVPFLSRGHLCQQQRNRKQIVLTLDGTLAIKLGAEHPQPEDQHHKGKEYPKAEANTPDRGKVILAGD